MATSSKCDIAAKIGKNIEKLVRNLHKFKINRKTGTSERLCRFMVTIQSGPLPSFITIHSTLFLNIE